MKGYKIISQVRELIFHLHGLKSHGNETEAMHNKALGREVK